MAHPRMYDEANPAIRRLRELCLALPEVFEKEAWGECTFRVTGGSMFAMTDCNHHDSGHVAVWIKAPPMVQEILVNADGKRFFVPPYVGAKGWVGVRLDYQVDWNELGEMLKDGHLMSAPKRLRARLRSTSEDEASRNAAPGRSRPKAPAARSRGKSKSTSRKTVKRAARS